MKDKSAVPKIAEDAPKLPTKKEDTAKQPAIEEDTPKLPAKKEDTAKLPAKKEDTEKLPAKEEDTSKQLAKIEDTPKSPEKKEDVTLYLGTITSLGSIFNALRHYIIRLRNFPRRARFATQASRILRGIRSKYYDPKSDDKTSTATVSPTKSTSKSSHHQAKPRSGKIRRMINVNQCAMKKKRRKLKLHLFKCEHLAKLLLLESYVSTEFEDQFFQTISFEEGVGIGRLILKMIKINEEDAVEELGQKTVDFMKRSIVEIEKHYIQNDLKIYI